MLLLGWLQMALELEERRGSEAWSFESERGGVWQDGESGHSVRDVPFLGKSPQTAARSTDKALNNWLKCPGPFLAHRLVAADPLELA